MERIILFLCGVLLIVRGDMDGGNIISSANLIAHAEHQYLKTLQNYDARVECLEKNNLEIVGKYVGQINILADRIDKMEGNLNLWTIESDFNKHCFTKYSSLIPAKHQITKNITNCMLEVKKHFIDLLTSLFHVRNSFQSYYTIDFQNGIKNCGERYVNTTANYSLCITSVASNFNSYGISNKNSFNNQMEEAQHAARTSIKRIGDCSYAVQARVLSSLAEASYLITNCFEGTDECKPCAKGFICPSIYDMQVDYEVEWISNPLLEHKNHTDCLMLRVKNHTQVKDPNYYI